VYQIRSRNVALRRADDDGVGHDLADHRLIRQIDAELISVPTRALAIIGVTDRPILGAAVNAFRRVVL
jgi:hypothetical protein